MGRHRFDVFITIVMTARNRRSLLGMLVGGGLGSILAGGDVTNARRKRRKKKSRRGRPSACEPSCTGKSCGDDGCGGSCGACTAGSVYTAGSCVCPQGTESCGGECRLACGPLTTRNPQSCRCCGISGTACDSADPVKCCSGLCTVDGTTCEGFPAGVSCRFGAQCASDRCVDGMCAA